jgi:hypothetical protein
MAENKEQARPGCLGRLEKVFPMGADGLRHTPPECLECGLKTDCLRAAVRGEQGLTVHEERLARAYDAGSVGFLERWALQKHLQRRKARKRGWLETFKRIRGRVH